MAGEHPKPKEWAELVALGEVSVPTPEELAEARILAVAAEGKQLIGLSEDAELGLGLLRVASQGLLDADAKQRIIDELPLPQRAHSEGSRGAVWFARKWLVVAGLLPAAVAGLLYWNNSAIDSRLLGPGGSNVVPAPNAALLTAQARWVASSDQREPFERSMNTYRLAVLEGLE